MLMYWNCYIDTWNFERIQFILFIWFFPAFEQHKCIRRCQSHRRLKAKVLSRGKMVSVSWLLCIFSHFKRVFVRFNDCYNSINTSSFLYVVECFIIWRVVDLFSCKFTFSWRTPDWESLLGLAFRRLKLEIFMGGGKVSNNIAHATHLVVLIVPASDVDFGSLVKRYS